MDPTNDILLSIIIPTKNRYETLINIVDKFLSWSSNYFEIIIQDNSEDNSNILYYFEEKKEYNRLHYYYTKENLPIVENINRAVLNSTGKYVVCIGDDDGISEQIMNILPYIEKHNIDAVSCKLGVYFWPNLQNDVKYRAPHIGALEMEKSSGKYYYLNPVKELKKILSDGARNLNRLPRLYQGLVSRKVLDEIYAKTNSYFPGAVPDMSNAVALCFYVKKHLYIEFPLFIAGNSSASMVGMGLRKQDFGPLENEKHLPLDIIKTWSAELPKFWSPQTIWAEGALSALRNTGNGSCINKYYNFNRIYAAIKVYTPVMQPILAKFLKENRLDTFSTKMKININIVIIYSKRAVTFIRRKILYSPLRGFFGMKIKHCNTAADAMQHIESMHLKQFD